MTPGYFCLGCGRHTTVLESDPSRCQEQRSCSPTAPGRRPAWLPLQPPRAVKSEVGAGLDPTLSPGLAAPVMTAHPHPQPAPPAPRLVNVLF